MKSIAEKARKFVQELTHRQFLFIVFIFWQFVSIIGLLVSHGSLWTNIVWSGDSTAIFPDFVETVFQSFGLKPYGTGAIYPPMVYVLFSVFTKVLPEQIFLNKTTGQFSYSNWSSASISPPVHILSCCFFVAAALLLFAVIKHYNKGEDENSTKQLIWIVFTSAPFLFAVDRGNILMLLIAPLMYFCVNYDSPNMKTRIFAYICLSLVVSFKIYPVLLGVLILFDRKNKNRFLNAFICIGIGVLIGFIPFIFTGGLDSVKQFLDNITAHTSRSSNSFGLGEKIDIVNSMKIIGYFIDASPDGKLVFLQKIAPAGVVIMGMMGAYLNREKWKSCLCLIIATILFPSFSVRYNVLYLTVPLILFCKNKEDKRKINFVYSTLFALCLAPFAFGTESFYSVESALCKLNLGTIIPAFSLIVFLLVLFIDGVVSRSKFSSNKLG